jgi:hypothetical protein
MLFHSWFTHYVINQRCGASVTNKVTTWTWSLVPWKSYLHQSDSKAFQCLHGRHRNFTYKLPLNLLRNIAITDHPKIRSFCTATQIESGLEIIVVPHIQFLYKSWTKESHRTCTRHQTLWEQSSHMGGKIVTEKRGVDTRSFAGNREKIKQIGRPTGRWGYC